MYFLGNEGDSLHTAAGEDRAAGGQLNEVTSSWRDQLPDAGAQQPPDSLGSIGSITTHANFTGRSSSRARTRQAILDHVLQHAFPTDSRERQKAKEKADKEAGIERVVKKKFKVVEDHFDDCGEDLNSICKDVDADENIPLLVYSDSEDEDDYHRSDDICLNLELFLSYAAFSNEPHYPFDRLQIGRAHV